MASASEVFEFYSLRLKIEGCGRDENSVQECALKNMQFDKTNCNCQSVNSRRLRVLKKVSDLVFRRKSR